MSKTAIIIGAGLGGMAAAIRLARRGWKVKILEKNIRVGGKLDCHGDAGFLWDVGPSLITMPFVLRDLFEDAGHDIEDYLELIPIDPVCRYFYPDGKVLNAWANFHHFQIEVARREKDHGEALENFMRYARGMYDLGSEAFLFHPPHKPWEYLRWRLLKQMHHLSKVLPPRSMADAVERFFKDPHVRQFFLNYATHRGSSPYLAPAAFSVLPYVELQGGGWYIRGGIYRLAEALEKCARDMRVEFLLDAEVSEIVLQEKGRFRKPLATGALLRGGLALEADAIICNTDVMHAWTRLLHTKRQSGMRRKLDRRPFSSSPFMICLGVKRRYEQLAHHNVFFSSDPIAEFNDLFQKKRPAAEPTVSVSISARTDATQAPPGQDNYLILVHAPSLETDHHWELARDSYRDVVLQRLEKMGLDGLRNEIVCEKVITPADFAARTNSHRGAMYGHATHSLFSLLNRPPNRSPDVERLYFVGGSARPGGGIPLALLSAQRVARAILENEE